MVQSRIFVSYSPVDGAFARRLVADLRTGGVQVQFDVAGGPAGNLTQQVDEALDGSDWLVLVLTSDAIATDLVRHEVDVALGRVRRGTLRGVIAVLAAPVPPGALPPEWDTLPRFDATADYGRAVALVLRMVDLDPAAAAEAARPGRYAGPPPARAPAPTPPQDARPDGGVPPPVMGDQGEPEEATRGVAPGAGGGDEDVARRAPPSPRAAPPVPVPPPVPISGAPAAAPAAPSAPEPPVAGSSGAPAPAAPAPPEPLVTGPFGQGALAPSPEPPVTPPFAPPPPAPAAPPGMQGATRTRDGPFAPPPPAPAAPPPSGGWAAPTAPAPAARPASAPQPALEDVAFTGYYPREVAPRVWERLLVFVALDTPGAAAEVESTAAERLARRLDDFRNARVPGRAALRRGTRLTLVPQLSGFRFDPASVAAEWADDVQCYEFRLRAEGAPEGTTANGVVQVFEGPLLRGEVPVAVAIRTARQPTPGDTRARIADVRGPAYRNTFPSYSRQDESVVRAFESVAEAGGDRFLRDVRALRAGDDWAPAILGYIERADVFQLFWSERAAKSQQVEREWRHALALLPGRPGFIRPVFWTSQPYRIPGELAAINFGHLDPNVLGLRQVSWLGRVFGGR